MIWLIDNSLQNFLGHHFQYALSLYQYAKDHDLDFRVLGHRELSSDLVHRLPVEPVFRHTIHDRFYSMEGSAAQPIALYLDFLRANYEFYRDLKSALTGRVGRDDILFMPTIDHRQLWAWGLWLRSQDAAAAPTVVLMARMSYFDPDHAAFWGRDQRRRRLRFIYKTLERLARGRRLRIATDSERLAREYSDLTRLPVDVFPIPHTEAAARAAAPGRTAPSKNVLRFVSLGDARYEKGFPLLVSAIQKLRDRNALQGIQFVLQCYIRIPHQSAMLPYRRILEDAASPGIELLDQPLNAEAYDRLVDSADVILLPYQRKIYYANTSGPMTEAFAAAKPVVVTDDTWMSDQLRRFGAGVTFKDGDAEDLARAILEVRARYPELAERAAARRADWIAFHNPKTFIEMLGAAARQPGGGS